ncbi:MAG TPA: efflux transporter outer membrane subunit [Burkholderiaceae bacterium]|nr:efflux transporter outer membrane subunit [Burkholderiaceae bacterium]
MNLPTPFGSTSRREARRATWRRAFPVAASVALSLAVASCAVGPDFKRPQPPLPGGPQVGPDALPREAGVASGTQRFVADAVAGPRWWKRFGSAPLDALVDEGLANSPDVRASRNALQRARDVLEAEQGLARWPSVDLQLQPARQRALNLPGFSPPTVMYDTYAAVVSVGYTFDLFGGERRANEAYAADADTRAAEFDATRLALASNIAATAIQSAALARRIQVANDAEHAAADVLDAAERRRALGRSGDAAVAAARRNLQAQRTALPQLRSAHHRARAALAVLLGRTPDRAPPDVDFDSLSLPSDLPLVVPADVVRQRPDVAAAEARLHAATARYGAAIANLYPQIQLSADWGRESYHYADLFSGPSAVWRIAASLTQPLFRGGALEAARRAAGLDQDSTLAAYVGTVLQALRAVADAQQALVEDAAAADAATGVAAASADLLAIDAKRQGLGALPEATLSVDRQQWLADEGARIAASAVRYVDTVAYLQALSGREALREAADAAGGGPHAGHDPVAGS